MSVAANSLLSGDPRLLTLRLALPSLFAMLASGLAVLLDALFLSRSSESLAAAVSLCFPLVTVIQTIGFTLGMGAGSFVSRTLGKENAVQNSDVQHAASTALYGAALLGTLLCLAGQFFPQPLLRLLGARNDVLSPSVHYARWVLASSPLTCASLVLGSLLRGQGKTIPGMVAYIAGTAVGTALCWFLVVHLQLGLSGAGAAMLAREATILLIFSLYTLRLPGILRPSLLHFSLRIQVLLNIMRSGVPTLIRQGLMSVSGVLLSRTCAQLGTAAVAGMGLALRAVNLVSSAIIGFGQGFAPVCGAAYGAGKTERLQAAYRFCLCALNIALALLGTAGFFAAPWLMNRFAPDNETAHFGSLVLRAQSTVFFAQGSVILMNMLTQAMGLPVRSTLVAAGRQGFIFIPLLFILPSLFGGVGLILTQPISDLLSLLLGWLLTKNLFSEGGTKKRRPTADAERHGLQIPRSDSTDISVFGERFDDVNVAGPAGHGQRI